jgi:hypothetical protein
MATPAKLLGRDPDNLNGAASGETLGPRFFFFVGAGRTNDWDMIAIERGRAD